MKADTSHNNLLDAIKGKIPQKDIQTKVLAEILHLGKEAIYRRLRGEVPFTLSESVSIAQALNISLDSILNSGSYKSRPFQFKMIDFKEPDTDDFAILQNFVSYIKQMGENPCSEMGCASNILPQPLYMTSLPLSNFYLLKWLYQHDMPHYKISFHEIVRTKEMEDIQKQLVKESTNIKNTYYIFDNMIFKYLVNDIKYFSSINLIRNEDIALLKEELLKLIHYIEQLTLKGCFDNGNKVHIYISNINIGSNCTYLANDGVQNISVAHTFTLNPIISSDNETFTIFKNRIQSLRKSSILITESGEAQRIQFMKQQIEYINSL